QFGPMLTAGERYRHFSFQMRIGYLRGLSKTDTFMDSKGTNRFEKRVTNMPTWFGGRVYPFHPYSGPYAGADIGLNVLTTNVEGNWPDGKPISVSRTDYRLGANGSLGLVVSQRVPLDIRAQFSVLNAALKDHGDEKTYMGLGFSVGYAWGFCPLF